MKRFLRLFKYVRALEQQREKLEQQLKQAHRCIYAIKTLPIDSSKLSTLKDLAAYEDAFKIPEAVELWEGVEALYWAQREKGITSSARQS